MFDHYLMNVGTPQLTTMGLLPTWTAGFWGLDGKGQDGL